MTRERGQAGIIPLTDGRLRFSCHPRISCFTACCADLHLILTPYDVLRMKKQLALTATEFIGRYTTPLESDDLFPLIRLKMRDDERRSCPFVSTQGCTVYEDRPGSCRLYPLGRASRAGGPGSAEGVAYFVVKESHCLGFNEEKEWTVEEWVEDQDIRLYNEMNRAWMEIVTGRERIIGKVTEQKLGMFHMASYDLDRFREFVFHTKFTSVFDLPAKEVEEAAANEVELMKLAMGWLKFVFFGEGTLVPIIKSTIPTGRGYVDTQAPRTGG